MSTSNCKNSSQRSDWESVWDYWYYQNLNLILDLDRVRDT